MPVCETDEHLGCSHITDSPQTTHTNTGCQCGSSRSPTQYVERIWQLIILWAIGKPSEAGNAAGDTRANGGTGQNADYAT